MPSTPNEAKRLIARVNDDCKPIAITNSKGKGAVLAGKDDWASSEELVKNASIYIILNIS